MEHWTKICWIFGVLELIQGLLLALWVWQRVWPVAALAAAMFLSILASHLIVCAHMLASWVIVQLRQPRIVVDP